MKTCQLGYENNSLIVCYHNDFLQCDNQLDVPPVIPTEVKVRSYWKQGALYHILFRNMKVEGSSYMAGLKKNPISTHLDLQ